MSENLTESHFLSWWPVITGVALVTWWTAVRVNRRIRLHFADPIVRLSILDKQCEVAEQALADHEKREFKKHDEFIDESRTAYKDLGNRIDGVKDLIIEKLG